MSNTTDEINAFLFGAGAKAFPFDNMGDMVSGKIVEMNKRQQTSIDDGTPQFWNNGDPKMMLVLTLQTELHDDDEDDGLRNIYLRGGNFEVAQGKGTSSLTAVRDAVKRSGSKMGIEVGGTLTLQWTGTAPKKGAYNPAKLYTAAYKAPSMAIDIDEMA